MEWRCIIEEKTSHNKFVKHVLFAALGKLSEHARGWEVTLGWDWRERRGFEGFGVWWKSTTGDVCGWEGNCLLPFLFDRGKRPCASHAFHYMEKVTYNLWVGLSVKMFKGFIHWHILHVHCKDNTSTRSSQCLIVYFVVVECAWQSIRGMFGVSSYIAYCYISQKAIIITQPKKRGKWIKKGNLYVDCSLFQGSFMDEWEVPY